MNPKITLRKIAPTTRDLADLREAAGQNADAASHCIAITLRAYQLKVEEMVAVASTVVQQQGRVPIVAHNHIRESIIVEVCERHASPDVWRLESAASGLRRFRELAVTLIVEQRVDLLEVNVRRDLLHFWINMAIGDESIKPAI